MTILGLLPVYHTCSLPHFFFDAEGVEEESCELPKDTMLHKVRGLVGGAGGAGARVPVLGVAACVRLRAAPGTARARSRPGVRPA